MKRRFAKYVVAFCSATGLVLGASIVAGATHVHTASAATKDPIVIGGSCNLTAFPGVDEGVKARIKRENDKGGVNGRKLKYIGISDAAGNTTNEQQIQNKLVNEDHVFAIVPQCQPALTTGPAQVSLDAAIPVFGYGSSSIAFCTNRNMFSINGCNNDVNSGDISWFQPLIDTAKLRPKGLRTWIVSINSPGQDQRLKVETDAAKRLGMNVVGTKTPNIPATPPTDYTPYAQEILDANVKFVDVFGPTPQVIGLVGALRAGGYTGVIQDFVTFNPTVLSNPDAKAALQGEYVLVQVPVAQDNTPAVRQEVKDLKAAGASGEISLGNGIGYWSADMFIAALQAAGPGATSQKVIDTANKWTYKPSLAGGAGPITYPEMRDAPGGCGALLRIKGSRFTSAAKYGCRGAIPLR